MKRATRLGSVLLMCLSGAVCAHHSFAMFDPSKAMTLDGTVKEFQWTNPHAWIQLNVANGTGGLDEWSLEGQSPNVLARTGWRPKSIKPGDKVSVRVNPLRDGSKGGSIVTVTLENGTVLANK